MVGWKLSLRPSRASCVIATATCVEITVKKKMQGFLVCVCVCVLHVCGVSVWRRSVCLGALI